MGRAVGAEAASLAERAGVALIRLHLLAAGGVHGREVRVGDNHLVAELFKETCNPLTLGRGLDEDARPWPLGEQGVETRSLGLDTALNQLTVFGQNTDLAGGLVDIYPDVFHDWPHSFCGLSPRVVVRRHYVATEVATSRFI